MKKESTDGLNGLSVRRAAALMNKDESFIRIGLQRKLLPFGVAIQTKEAKGRHDSGRWSYYISPKKFEEFTGIDPVTGV